MPLPSYATRDDLGRLGIPPAALAPIERTVELVDPSTNRLVLRGHGLVAGDRLRVFSRAGASGQPGGTSATTPYEAFVVSEDLFELRNNGAPVDISSAGTAPILMIVDPRPAIDQALYTESRWVDEHATAHKGPFEPDSEGKYPATIVDTVCKRAAMSLAITRGLLHPSYKESAEGLERRATEVSEAFRRWIRGKPIVGAVDNSPTTADNAAIAGSLDQVGDAADWGSYL
jgi:hypothetical protein